MGGLSLDVLAGAPGLLGPDLWWWALLYFAIIFVGQGAPVLLALGMDGIPEPAASDAGPWPSVSIIVPARNEADALGATLDALAAQDYRARGGRLEVLVVDGGSTDGTRTLAERHPSRPRVLAEPPLPAGWVGKSWGCETGQRAATGEMLLFLDADTVLAPPAVRMAVAQQRATQADLLTLASRIVMEGFWERVVMPLYVQFVLLYFVAPRVNRDDSSRAMANGQFMLFSRASYDRFGGHARVRGDVLEDVRLAQEVKSQGGRLRLYWAPELLSTHMYREPGEMREGILKNLHGTKFRAGRLAAWALALVVFFLSPFAVLVAAAAGLLPWPWLVVSLVLIALTALKQTAFQRSLGAPLRYGISYPLGVAYYLGLIGTSLRLGLGHGRVTWKGRSYAMDGEAPPPTT